MKYEYQTIEKPIENVLVKEKGSKFIGFAYPILSENDYKEKLNKIKESHPKATHHCYAFRLELNGENYRINDDGEPSGSAGLPIYNQLLAHDVTNVLLIIVRYFGGTKLGVGGLVKTYKESAKATLEEAKIITKELETEKSNKVVAEKEANNYILDKEAKRRVRKLERTRDELMNKIETLEEEIQVVNNELAKEEVYTDMVKTQEFNEQLKQLSSELEELNDSWLEIEEELESING